MVVRVQERSSDSCCLEACSAFCPSSNSSTPAEIKPECVGSHVLREFRVTVSDLTLSGFRVCAKSLLLVDDGVVGARMSRSDPPLLYIGASTPRWENGRSGVATGARSLTGSGRAGVEIPGEQNLSGERGRMGRCAGLGRLNDGIDLEDVDAEGGGVCSDAGARARTLEGVGCKDVLPGACIGPCVTGFGGVRSGVTAGSKSLTVSGWVGIEVPGKQILSAGRGTRGRYAGLGRLNDGADLEDVDAERGGLCSDTAARARTLEGGECKGVVVAGKQILLGDRGRRGRYAGLFRRSDGSELEDVDAIGSLRCGRALNGVAGGVVGPAVGC